MIELSQKYTFILFLIIFINTPIDIFSQSEKFADIIDSTNTVRRNIEVQIVGANNLKQSERVYLEAIVSPLAGGVVSIPSAFIALAIGEAIGYNGRYDSYAYMAIG